MEKIERQGTINDINDLYEDGYKALYLDMCQHFKYERECNERLENMNKDLQCLLIDILVRYEIENDEYIKKQKELIQKNKDKVNAIARKYKK